MNRKRKVPNQNAEVIVLETLSTLGSDVMLRDLVDACPDQGVTTSTAYKVVERLVDRGVVTRSGVAGKYRVAYTPLTTLGEPLAPTPVETSSAAAPPEPVPSAADVAGMARVRKVARNGVKNGKSKKSGKISSADYSPSEELALVAKEIGFLEGKLIGLNARLKTLLTSPS